ncbi:MAG: hypothetical protein KJP08_00650 [Gammaproteobacteria bacterium]|nr:hypothetical protein [Gammaproteobacteria bacterium]NNF50493.1 hypothetical protein [Woeseiaceae bacterium]MBT8093290.1 hypothetical protein [Gammaproteobacteria bacterium]MBT8106096.1 hypothetical protein [Gammaproteobacteria bacterium]NNK26110.1 hypothetical protein [Woeseiaceae bacterium]
MVYGNRVVLLVGAVLLSHLLSGCENESQEPSAAQRALDELQSKYDELVKDKVDIPVDWAAEDLENIGDWEYRVINLSYSSPEDLESQLNEYGNERWEVIWLEESPDGFLAVLKKPSISYLSKIPLSQLGRIVIRDPEGQE